jgi:hypothetical protein
VVSSTSIIEAELERILKSRWLRESSQLSALLSYVVGETQAGRESGLKEYSLGLEVFHRPKDYDPRNDAIVRVQASLLRKRLVSYYENEGKDSTLRIDIPRGGYVAEFRECLPAIKVAPQVEPPKPKPFARIWLVFAAGLLLGALLVAAAVSWSNRPPAIAGRSIWGAFLNSDVEAVASFGVPLFYTGRTGIFVRDVRVNSPSEEADGNIPWISEQLKMRLRPQEDVYTGVGDAIGTHLVARWLEARGARVTVANSNYIGPSDIEGKNLVVVASARFQTMLQNMKFENRYHFQINGSQGGFRLDDPLPGEQSLYELSSGPGVNIDYAVVSLWPGKKPGTRILYVSGVNTWSTQGAAQFVLDNNKLAELQQRLDADAPKGPRGNKSPFFQILLQVEGKNNRVRGARYISHRYLPSPN